MFLMLICCIQISSLPNQVCSQDQENSEAALLDYLSGQHTRKQLEFTGKQDEDFRKIQEEYTRAWKGVYADFPELKDKSLPAKAREELTRKLNLQVEKIRRKFGRKAKGLLVPRQFELIHSLKFQQTVKAYGFAYAVSNSPFADQLKTTEQQKNELASIRQETQKLIEEKISELKAKAKKEMLRVLDAKQRRSVTAMEDEFKN